MSEETNPTQTTPDPAKAQPTPEPAKSEPAPQEMPNPTAPQTQPASGTTPAQSTAPQMQPSGTESANTEPVKQDTSKPTQPTPEQIQPAEVLKLSDVIPTSKVWISGMVGSRQIDCAGPIELPFALTKPEWPYTTVAPNPAYTNQVFDYGAGKWVPTDAKSQGQLLTDLAKQVTTLKDDSQKHDQTADQSQKMGMQLTKVMIQLSSKVNALNTKIDGIANNEKDGDK